MTTVIRDLEDIIKSLSEDDASSFEISQITALFAIALELRNIEAQLDKLVKMGDSFLYIKENFSK